LNISIANYSPPSNQPGTFYLVTVDKTCGLTEKYVIRIHKQLTSSVQQLLLVQYPPNIVLNDFYCVDFYLLNRVGTDGYLYERDGSMHYDFAEFRELLRDGVGAAMHDFITNVSPKALIAIPDVDEFGPIYSRLMKHCAQKLGYNYNGYFEEYSVYVIET